VSGLCNDKHEVLYLSYTGLMEPLGRSQVLAYLSRLSNEFSFTVVSFEKRGDLVDSLLFDDVRGQCNALGIRWVPRVYHRRPRIISTLWDILIMAWLTLYYCVSGRSKLVHSRSYVPTAVAWVCGKATGVPYLFDMRALWPEELVSSGRLRNGGILYRIIKWAERRMLADAAGIVSLTNAAVSHLKGEHPATDGKAYKVITTCVDLDRFSVQRRSEVFDADSHLVIGAMGTLTSGWFHLDWLFRFFAEVKRRRPSATLKLVTRDSPERLFLSARQCGINVEDIEITASSPQDVPAHLADMAVALMFFKAGIGKLGSAPTRMAEVLACGIPVVGNTGVGDMGHLIQHYNVGVLLEDGSPGAISAAVDSLLHCLEDADLALRCSSAAKEYFSADIGADRYRDLYRSIIGS